MILELYGVSVSSRVLDKNSESGAHSCFGEDGCHILMVSPGSDTRWTLSLDSDFIKEASISGSSSGRRRGSSSRGIHGMSFTEQIASLFTACFAQMPSRLFLTDPTKREYRNWTWLTEVHVSQK